jgi:DNA-binding NarL/FixJ family response regulator
MNGRQARSSRKQKHLNLYSPSTEVLQLLSAGLTMKEIASRLGISTRTAESHKYEMMEGLGVGSTAELVQYAIKLGITSTNDHQITQITQIFLKKC